ncbi:MAG: biotin--[acetyl-CoA-carboxylase] ligase [Bacteroidales bacterium]|nr:biotin--[acetyl-CoA-carboxylase] ligase [Bacteroidales bacterium]
MIVKLPATHSTNSYMQEVLSKSLPEEGTLVWTPCQTAGRGQCGNAWESEPGKNITCSAVFYPAVNIQEQFLVSEAVSLAVIDFMDILMPGCRIKWPNDIYYGDFKVAGILIEQNLYGKRIDSCVAGVGININQKKFRSDAPNPLSVSLVTGETYDVELLLPQLQEKLTERMRELKSPCLHQEYMSRLYRKEGFFLFSDASGVFVARICDVQSNGYLVLETDKKEKRCYAFKEVEFVIK